MRNSSVAGWLLIGGLSAVGLAVSYVWWHSPGKTAPITDEDGEPLPDSIASLETVEINGTKQWLLIRGQDRTKPVLLFLHGGPGLSELSMLSGHELETDFVVVNWEQRGAGKSYDARVFNDSFTVDTFVDDAVEVSRLLVKRFNQPKIYLMAHSWGTFLGVLTAKKYPELFHAFFSVSQIARQMQAEQISYDWVLQQARERNAIWQVRKLTKQGRPPYPPAEWLDYLTWQRTLVGLYRGIMYKTQFLPLFIKSVLLCPEYTLLDKIHYGLGAQENVRRLWPQVVAMDLFQEAPKLDVPYYLFQGVYDRQTPYGIAQEYFDQLDAPEKRMFTFEESAHCPLFEESALFLQIVKELTGSDTYVALTPQAE